MVAAALVIAVFVLGAVAVLRVSAAGARRLRGRWSGGARGARPGAPARALVREVRDEEAARREELFEQTEHLVVQCRFAGVLDRRDYQESMARLARAHQLLRPVWIEHVRR